MHENDEGQLEKKTKCVFKFIFVIKYELEMHIGFSVNNDGKFV